MNFFRAQYIEVNIIGIIMLSVMFIYTVWIQRDVVKAEQKYFVTMLAVNIIQLFLDTAVFTANYHRNPLFVNINRGMCAMFFSLHGCFSYLWIMYCIKMLYPEYKMERLKKILISLPFAAVVCIAFMSIKNGWLYFITDENIYLKGKYIYLMVILTVIYWLMGLILDIKEIIQQDRVREKTVYVTLALFPFPIFIGNILQIKYDGLSIIWISAALALLILFINVQNNHVSRDSLTGLFNKRQTNRQIAWEIKHLKNAEYYLFSIMIDVDRFKQINDTYGHLMGDKALIDVAHILRRNFRKKDFIGRFGGDEFIVMGHIKNPEEINILTERIKYLENEYNNKNSMYHLSLSVGYSIFTKDDDINLEYFIAESDRKMYEIKKQGRE